MVELTEVDRKFYSQNAPALIGYLRYVEYVIENKDKFGGAENVSLALQIGKFIGRNDIDHVEFGEMKEKISRFCKDEGKARKIMEAFKDEGKLEELVTSLVSKNPESFMIVDPNGGVLKDGKGNPVPNLMKVSLAIAKELSG